MLSNAVIAAVIAAAYVVMLILHLNPGLRLDDPAAWPLIGAVLLAYGVHLAVLFYAGIVTRQLLTTDTVSPGWLSYGVLSWFCSASTTAAAALMWLNLRGFAAALDPATRDSFFTAAMVMTGCAAACLLLAVFRSSVADRSRLAAFSFGVVVIASLVLPVIVRGRGVETPLGARRFDRTPPLSPDESAHRVFVLAVDGASLDFISPAVAEGRLPNFGRVLDGGASMHLATLRPTQLGPVWTAVATGQLPAQNGVRSAATYTALTGSASIDLLPDFCFAHALVSVGLLAETEHTSSALRAQPVWSILGRAGLSSTIVRWPLTWPAQPMRGAMITEQYHRASETMLALDEPGMTYPTELALDLRLGAQPVSALAQQPGQQLRRRGQEVVQGALALDRFYIALADQIELTMPARLSAVRLQGLDTVGHVFLRFAVPRAFGDVSEEERRQHGRVIEQYYQFVDDELGRMLDRLTPGDLLLVISPFGLEPLSLPKRLLESALGNTTLSGTHERAPDGFLVAYGSAVRPGRYARGSVADVTPTLLYFFGLPVGRDMDGFARADLFAAAFTAERPIAYIPSYER